DDPIDIASGPTVPDPTTCRDALNILRRYAIDVPPRALALLESGEGETLKPGDARLPPIETRFVATPQMALEAAASVAREAGLTPYILGDAIEGEARDVAKTMAGIALQVARRGQPFAAPCVLVSGGETTVTVRGRGRGGRNVEFLLSLAIALDGEPGIHALAGDTDGVDGQEATHRTRSQAPRYPMPSAGPRARWPGSSTWPRWWPTPARARRPCAWRASGRARPSSA